MSEQPSFASFAKTTIKKYATASLSRQVLEQVQHSITEQPKPGFAAAIGITELVVITLHHFAELHCSRREGVALAICRLEVS